jgi:hypothetical protein
MNFKNVFNKCFSETDAAQNIYAALGIIILISGSIFWIYPKFSPDIIIRAKVSKNTVAPIEFINSNKDLLRELDRLEFRENIQRIKVDKERLENHKKIISFLDNPIFDRLSFPDKYFDKLELEIINKSEKDISNIAIQISDKLSSYKKPVIEGNISGDFLDDSNIKKFKSLFKYSEVDKIIINDIPKIPRKTFIKIEFNGDFDDIEYIDIKIGGEVNYSIKKVVEIEDSIWIQAINRPIPVIIVFIALTGMVMFLIANREDIRRIYFSKNKKI